MLTRNMKVLERITEKEALAKFILERLEYEQQRGLDHNSRNYETRKKFKQAGFLPKYTNDDALGDFQIADTIFEVDKDGRAIVDKHGKLVVKHTKLMSGIDYDLISDNGMRKIGFRRPKKVEYTADAKIEDLFKNE